MSLQTRRPPGHAKRKALTYAADIISLRAQGHSFSAIREALEDAGVVVSISTVRREVLKGRSITTTRLEPKSAQAGPHDGLSCSRKTAGPVLAPDSAREVKPLSGKAIAEEFMRSRPTNALFIEEPSK